MSEEGIIKASKSQKVVATALCVALYSATG
jgi:hypothetical protein